MKRFTVLVIIALSATLFSPAQAQTIKEVMEQTWIGATRLVGGLQGGKYVHIKQMLYDVDYNSSTNTFTAKLKATLRLDKDYKAIYEVTGSLNTDVYQITIKPGKKVYTDPLPGDMHWTADAVIGTLMKDSKNPGHFMIQGTTASMRYDDEIFELYTKH